MDEAVQAHKIMRVNGVESGYILNGGFDAWKAKGYPLESDKLLTKISYDWTPLPGAIFIPDYEKIVKNRPVDTVIIDVRSPGEYMKSMVPGALTIPIDTLERRLSEIPKNRKIVLQCEAGNRALIAWRVLKDNGFKEISWVDGHISKYSKGILQEGAYKK
jgi:rhodanese-related sulfurtransferase